MSDRKAVAKNADTPEDTQQDAIDLSTQALEKPNTEKYTAAHKRPTPAGGVGTEPLRRG